MKQRKPYSAVTVQVDQLTGEDYDENDLGGIVDLIEVIRIQESGPTEAARALRKKLKYGSPHRQLRALVILDGLIQNAGSRFQRTFADEPLLERLRTMPRDEMVDSQVRDKCNLLFRQWAVAYKKTPGLERIAALHKQLPQKARKPQPHQSRVIRETEAEAASPPSSPSTSLPDRPRAPSTSHASLVSAALSSRPVTLAASESHSSSFFRSSKDKKNKNKAFNLEKEKPRMLETIAQASVASTNLYNGLKLINRENQRVSENAEVSKRFETCKTLRRQILRYIQLVESEQWIGSLLSANDELVKALMAFEIMDKSIDDDSDSDAESYAIGKAAFASRSSMQRETEATLAGLDLNEAAPPKPPRPGSIAMPPTASAHSLVQPEEDEEEEDVDENDPFGDQNAVKTPFVEKDGMTW
ncbi:hypothetical protein K402DRAFT_340982 [Aulographum hederae CBS 113979]|uniref:VHS domain-containing protein n=1 Tax=Aulographum hederae CBS 113979 TaxID=1176131 RepID=A0A6G1GMQ7_9PEZI|nr:hypothetical protein K402DRAFT_340982 [Aulographum hederae CBS 113979]